MRRGEVWWASLPTPDGSGPGLRRPVLILQSNPFNESAIGTVVVGILTSNLALAQARGNVRVSRAHSGLPKVSVMKLLGAKLRGIFAKFSEALPPSFATATAGSPRLHPRSKLRGIQRRRMYRR